MSALFGPEEHARLIEAATACNETPEQMVRNATRVFLDTFRNMRRVVLMGGAYDREADKDYTRCTCKDGPGRALCAWHDPDMGAIDR